MGVASVILTAWGIIIILAIGFYFFYKFIFLRDPKREVPAGNNIVSPADGKIISVAEVKGDKIRDVRVKKGSIGKVHTLARDIADECYIISIFMNLMNVHVNRTPAKGKVEKTTYEKGRFLPANRLKRGLTNEKNEIIIKNDRIGKIKIIQIAGFMARRIECWVEEGQNLIKGQRIGMIHMGSQVTLILPKKVDLKVKKGEKVKAGTSIIAEC